MNHRDSALAVVLFVCLGAVSVCANETETTLDAFQQTISQRPPFKIECSSTIALEHGKPQSSETLDGGIRQATYFRDGRRVDIKMVQSGFQLVAGPNGAQQQRPRRVQGCSIVDGWYLSYPLSSSGKPGALAMFAPDAEQFVGAALSNLGGLEALEGYVANDYVSFVTILRSATNVRLNANETVDGHRCVLVEGDSAEYGRYSVWFDPSAGYYPRKIKVVKGPNHLWMNRRIRDYPFVPWGTRASVPAKSFEVVVDKIELDNTSGALMPVACRVTDAHYFERGYWKTTVWTCRRTSLVVKPDFTAAKAFTPELPDGARLVNQQDSQLPYEWRRGQPLPRVDPAAVKQMDSTAAELRKELAGAGSRPK